MKSIYILLILNLLFLPKIKAQVCITHPLVGPTELCTTEITTYSLNGITIGAELMSSNTSVLSVGKTPANAGIVTAVSPGTATLYYLYRMNCGLDTIVELSVRVGNFPPQMDTILGSKTVSIGTTTAYSLGSNNMSGVWSVSPPSLASISNTGVLTPITPGQGKINYTVTNPCGTTVTSKDIIILGCDTILSGTILVPSSMCVNSTFNATYSGSQGGVWSSTSSIIQINSATGLITALNTGMVRVIYSLNDGCGFNIGDTSDLITITNSSTTGITGKDNICIGEISFYNSDTLDTGGIWNSSNPSVARFIGFGQLYGEGSGTTIISYTISGCNPITKVVNVDILRPKIACPPSITVSPKPNRLNNCSVSILSDPTLYGDNCYLNTLKYAITNKNNVVVLTSPQSGINLLGTIPYPVGVWNVFYQATDLGGLTNTCNFTITVKSTVPCKDPLGIQSTLESRSDNNEERHIVVNLSPNPFISNTRIQVSSDKSSPISIQVFTLTGKLIENRIIQGPSSALHVGNTWPIGIYIARIRQNEFTESIKLIKKE